MSDGNKFVGSAYAQQRQQNRFPFESMGNVLLDAMQGTLVCLDSSHIIIGVSKTVKRCFGFEQADIIGLSILLFIEDSERDAFLKFLNSPSQSNDVHYARMTMNHTNEYRQVKIHRKKKTDFDVANVHSTTTGCNQAVATILIVTLEDSTYIDITLHDIHKQEFYTKMNLMGQIIFEDHRGALITGYLPHEIISKSIFNFVHEDDRLVKLHALWKCVTTGLSKLQWRLNNRNGSLVFLQTEYKLISDQPNRDVIIARNEVLSPIQRSQFDELQTAWKHQCKADIKGNSSSFKYLSQSEADSLSTNGSQCRIYAPTLNICFTTDKLQPLNLQGNVFSVSKSARPLTLQDYIEILLENEKNMDSELVYMINNIQSLTAFYRRLNDPSKLQQNGSDQSTDDKGQSDPLGSLTETPLRHKQDSESIVRGLLNNSIKYNHEKQSGDSPSTLVRLLNGNAHSTENGNTKSTTSITTSPATGQQYQMNQPQLPPTPISPNTLQLPEIEFLKKYRSAKARLESQLEALRRQETIDGSQVNYNSKRNIILNKLIQLENIKKKHFIRPPQQLHQTSTAAATHVTNPEQKDTFKNNFSSAAPPPPKPIGVLPMDTSNTQTTSMSSSMLSSSNDQSLYYSRNYQDQQNFVQQEINSRQILSNLDSKNCYFDDFLTSSSYSPVFNNNNNNNNIPATSVNSHMNASFQGTTNDAMSQSPFTNHQNNTTYPY